MWICVKEGRRRAKFETPDFMRQGRFARRALADQLINSLRLSIWKLWAKQHLLMLISVKWCRITSRETCKLCYQTLLSHERLYHRIFVISSLLQSESGHLRNGKTTNIWQWEQMTPIFFRESWTGFALSMSGIHWSGRPWGSTPPTNLKVVSFTSLCGNVSLKKWLRYIRHHSEIEM